eukprot:10742793-Alexandrium_andersonii.AAC.1
MADCLPPAKGCGHTSYAPTDLAGNRRCSSGRLTACRTHERCRISIAAYSQAVPQARSYACNA